MRLHGTRAAAPAIQAEQHAAQELHANSMHAAVWLGWQMYLPWAHTLLDVPVLWIHAVAARGQPRDLP